jgi:flagellar basal body rod protein FlgF
MFINYRHLKKEKNNQKKAEFPKSDLKVQVHTGILEPSNEKEVEIM